jgi:hypothetical protein
MRVDRLSRWRTWLSALALVAGGSGSLLAALTLEPWVAVTTAVSAGAISYLATLQADTLIAVYNQTATELRAIRRRWLTRADAAPIKQLVDETERALAREGSGWVQRMSRAQEDAANRA